MSNICCNMESSRCSFDPCDEVRKLQDKVRRLELQNEQLRSQQLSRNGLIEKRQSRLSCVSDDESSRSQTDTSLLSLDDNYIELEDLDNEEFLNDEIWLNKSRRNVNNTPQNLVKWLRQDIENHNDYEMQRIRMALVQKIDEIEQGSRRNSIDTRTFTRPKKRLNRPNLETMTESRVMENKLSLSPWQKLLANHVITENIDDFSLKFDNTLPSLTDTPNLNHTFSKNNVTGYGTAFQKVASDTRLNMSSDIRADITFLKTDVENQIFHRPCDSEISNGSRKASDPSLNTTFIKTPEVIPSQLSPRSRSITPSGLNCTFSVADGSYRNGRATSCDSMADDDQLSSASDSSFSSATRLMNVGDVQNIARLQEESLKQVTSTPKRSCSRDGITLGHVEELLSPIKRGSQDIHPDYHSDHSDHSFTEERVKSARSSVRSSPAGSPFGSTYALTHDGPPSNTAMGVPRRELKLLPPPPRKQEVLKPQSVVRQTEQGRGRPMSGIRPPLVRPQGATTAITRPGSAGISNIPRPQSRIPAPRTRSAACSAQPKADWMDGCY